jgi:hypothetical protein
LGIPVNDLLTSLSGWMKEHPKLTKAISLTSLALGALFLVGGSVIWMTGKFITGISEGALAWMKFSSFVRNTECFKAAAQGIRSLTLATYLNVRSLWAQISASRVAQAVSGWWSGAIGGIKAFTVATWGSVSALWGTVQAYALSARYAAADWFGKAVRGITAFTTATWGTVTALWAQAAAWAATPFGMVSLAIVGLIAVGVLLWKNWDKVVGFFKGAWAWLTALFHKTPTWVLLMVPFIGVPLAIIKNWDKIKPFFAKVLGWITGFAKSMWKGGANLVKSIWDGMKSMAHKPVEAIQAIMQKVRRFLPFSPAKEGPLSDIHRLKFMETIAASMKPDAVLDKIRQTALLASKAFRPVVTAAMAVTAGAATAGTSAVGPSQGARGQVTAPITVNLTINHNVSGSSSPNDETAFMAMAARCAPKIARMIQEEVHGRGSF